MTHEIFSGLGKRLTRIEEGVLGGPTWATATMSFAQRLKFFRDTGEWPGMNSKAVTEMSMQGNIDAERADGKDYCAARKLERAREAGLKVK